MFRNITEYNEKYYMESERAYISELNQKMIDNDSAFAESWVKSMGKILDMACQVQDKANKEMDVIIPCRYMRLSFLHITTFIGQYDPCFMVGFFADDGDNPWAKARIRATDVLGDWHTFAGQAYRKDIWYTRYYNPDAIQALLVQTQQKLLYIWLNRARYWMRELEDTPEFRKLSVTEDFQITVGAYRD